MRSKVISLRIDAETDQALRRASARSGSTRTGVIVAAIKDYDARALATAPERPYERVKDLIGIVDGPAEPLSERTGSRFRQKLRKAARDRR